MFRHPSGPAAATGTPPLGHCAVTAQVTIRHPAQQAAAPIFVPAIEGRTAGSTVKSAKSTLPVSLDYTDIEIRSCTKLFSNEPDYGPGVLRVHTAISIHDFPDEDRILADDSALAQIDRAGLSTISRDGGHAGRLRASAMQSRVTSGRT